MISSRNDNWREEYVKKISSELLVIHESREKIWRQENKLRNLPEHLVVSLMLTYHYTKMLKFNHWFPDEQSFSIKIPERLHSFGDEYDTRVQELNNMIRFLRASLESETFDEIMTEPSESLDEIKTKPSESLDEIKTEPSESLDEIKTEPSESETLHEIKTEPTGINSITDAMCCDVFLS